MYKAKMEWVRLNEHTIPRPKLTEIIHRTRWLFDFTPNCLSAASNHLASSMWHLHEDVREPLGKKYKSAKQVYTEWNTTAHRRKSYDILDVLLNDSHWKSLLEYRDSWNHRALPVIEGEARHRRRPVWQPEHQPAPGKKPLLKATDGKGKVAYYVSADNPEWEILELLDIGCGSVRALIGAAERFLEIHDAAWQERGITFDPKTHRVYIDTTRR